MNSGTENIDLLAGRAGTGIYGFRYSFNGKEKLDEVSGGGNTTDFGARIYDSRIGRFLSVDPKTANFSSRTPYDFAANNPIKLIDVNGEGPGDPVAGEKENTTESDKRYTQTVDNKPETIYVVAPDGKLHGFSNKGFDYTYSDGKETNGGHKIEGVWQIVNDEGHFMWNNVEGRYVKNTSGDAPGQNVLPGLGHSGTTYAGGENPSDYSQPPQNIADAGGLIHDQAYDALGLVGFEGVMDQASTPSNEALIAHSQQVVEMYKTGQIDPYTGTQVTMETYHQALVMIRGFQIAEALKIERDLQQNYRLEREFEMFMDEEYMMYEGGWARATGIILPY